MWKDKIGGIDSLEGCLRVLSQCYFVKCRIQLFCLLACGGAN